jgi:hypothetical protein
MKVIQKLTLMSGLAVEKETIKPPNMVFKPYLVVHEIGLAENYDYEDSYALGWKGIERRKPLRRKAAILIMELFLANCFHRVRRLVNAEFLHTTAKRIDIHPQS